MAKAPSNSAARQASLINSLQLRYAAAVAHGDAEAKLALFREAAYLDIRPELLEPASLAAG
ncbi:hypothetical protein KBY66_00810 [Synechococcus sp. Tobar12-5m-g]|uniref:hypothetical protein n=1 Tax=unclassified Synechococcus TaxID=2626047 RepID=UPI0020CDF57A|nr:MULTISPECIES: hypothetical protein [unclassified Synechococcus]MCP9771176.1 hypothetical protein [Synechococcus sp. Tobar12-5m-g]MCP9872116.1 hypothetical protein [Synechococcus sp. Cruz CV-v-12]